MVLPFTLGVIFIILYASVGTIRILLSLTRNELINLFKSLFSIKIIKTLKDILSDVLLHIKIFRKNILLGYMHASIAFGWFMLILIGHIEVLLYTPQRNGVIYYPVFFRFFVTETNETLRGAFFFFLMDLFLLIVLSGVSLAVYKRFRSRRLGMKRTTKLKPGDTIALYSLWLIFPLRLIAESFTADISGGSFLTESVNWVIRRFPDYESYMLPAWWAYSSTLALFLFSLPFSRYMHIPTEILLIFLRNAGIKSSHSRDGFAETEIYSCSSCGICIDACPMSVIDNKTEFTTVYLLRRLRRRKKDSLSVSKQCLMCGKCVIACPVEIDSCRLKLIKKSENFKSGFFEYKYLNVNSGKELRSSSLSIFEEDITEKKVAYYAGCMTHLTPGISKSLLSVLDKASINYSFIDKDGSVCCGRPLLLSGGVEAAKDMIKENSRLIRECGASILLLSCPICCKVFREEYKLDNITILHHTEYLEMLISESVINIRKGDFNIVYHDPCELGRGLGIYSQPRSILDKCATLKEAKQNSEESICCGGSLASLKFKYKEREMITQHSLENLTYSNPDIVATACPLCLSTFNGKNNIPTLDIAQIVENQII